MQVHGLTQGQMAAFQYHGRLSLAPLIDTGSQSSSTTAAQCPWLIVDSDALPGLMGGQALSRWVRVQTVRRPSDDNEDVVLWRRIASEAEPIASGSNNRNLVRP